MNFMKNEVSNHRYQFSSYSSTFGQLTHFFSRQKLSHAYFFRYFVSEIFKLISVYGFFKEEEL